MQSSRIVRSSEINRSPRVIQLEGLFDIPPASRSSLSWNIDLPIEDKPWNIGLVVGPSGSGKSTILTELFTKPIVNDWPHDSAVVDGFPVDMSVKDVTAALSSVGFSSPPSWLRPYNVLSNGEQFRADLARTLVESSGVAVIDEFTSVVDRTVAKVASSAVAKHIRRDGKQLVVASCHYDIIDWLQPDWLYDTGNGVFEWRSLQHRPAIELEVYRTTADAWRIFHPHHYLSGGLHKAAACYVALVEGRPAAFASVMHFPHGKVKNLKREHRTVCLPDFQGVGIGNALSDLIASVYTAGGFRYRSVTSSPAMIRHRARSSEWHMDRKPSMTTPAGESSSIARMVKSVGRITATFEYVGPKATAEQVAALLR